MNSSQVKQILLYYQMKHGDVSGGTMSVPCVMALSSTYQETHSLSWITPSACLRKHPLPCPSLTGIGIFFCKRFVVIHEYDTNHIV